MWQSLHSIRPKADLLVLEMNTARAGMALACQFSSSDEFEAAVIKSRVRNRAYEGARLRRHVVFVVAATGIAAAACLFV